MPVWQKHPDNFMGTSIVIIIPAIKYLKSLHNTDDLSSLLLEEHIFKDDCI